VKKLTHLDKQGKVKMVDITKKAVTNRVAVAKGSVYVKRETLNLLTEKKIPKGDVITVSKIAGIMAAKKASAIIPLCHPLNLTTIDIDLNIDKKKGKIDITAKVKVAGQTGVEIEALTAVSITALTIYDMCKAVDREMTISDVMLVEKSGGKSGTFKRK
jgi:cyclic pyranopterin phosphate synthase